VAEAPQKQPDAGGSTGIQTAPPEGLPFEGEAYRPLSLLALSGFALAVIYALAVLAGGLAMFWERNRVAFIVLLVLAGIVGALGPMLSRERRLGRLAASAGLLLAVMATVLGLGSLVAFSASKPWELPGWTWLLVAGAVLISWLARSRIQASEGTLEGTWLARWGILVGLFFGGYYALYTAGNIVAVRGQARESAEAFLKKIQKSELVDAYLMSLRANDRAIAEKDPRGFIEATQNGFRSPQAPGPFTTFRLADFTRFLQNSSEKETKIEYVGAPWEFREGGYEVRLLYRVTTPEQVFEMRVAVFGQQPERGPRQWHVLLQQTGMTERIATTQAGRDMEMLAAFAGETARGWCASLSAGQIDSAYLLTLPEARRTKGVPALVLAAPAGAAVVGVAGLAAAGTPAERAEFQKGRDTFATGASLDTREFWADAKFRAPILAAVRKAFAGRSPGAGIDLGLLPPSVPLVVAQDGKSRTLSFGVRGTVYESGRAAYAIAGDLTVEAPPTPPQSPGEFRVIGLSLRRGQTAPAEGPAGRELP
jgi:hypothetical protein